MEDDMSETGSQRSPVEAILPRRWDITARAYLARLGDAEYAEWLMRRSSRKSDRYSPSDYHRELIELLNRGDEEGFKYRKMLSHEDSALYRAELREEKRKEMRWGVMR